jgi:hypothetical protein
MNPNDPNVALLERAAEHLGEALLEQLVFVGGAVAGVLITDPAMPEIRPTQDVDVICRVIARSDYHQLGSQLRQRGFQEDSRPGAPLCRWCADDLVLDLMPTQGEILGFSNRWYPLALDTAQPQELPSGRSVRIVTAPVFLATKLEAFRGRGQGDFLFSHDLEDLMAVVDGRLRVLGVAGLRVADASVMPTVIGGNTSAPTMMIGEKAADMILGRTAPPRDL